MSGFNNYQKPLQGERFVPDREFLSSVYDASVQTKSRRSGGILQANQFGDMLNQSTFLVKNETGSTIEKYGIIKLGDPVYDIATQLEIFQGQPAFEGDTPTADCDFAIYQDLVGDDELGFAVLSGCSPCRINVTDESHTHAKAGTSSDRLESSTSGPAQIKWKESGTGVKEAFVLLGHAAEGGDSVARNWCQIDSSGNTDGTTLVIDSFSTTDTAAFSRIGTTITPHVDAIALSYGVWKYRSEETEKVVEVVTGGPAEYLAFSQNTGERNVYLISGAIRKLFAEDSFRSTTTSTPTASDSSRPLQAKGFTHAIRVPSLSSVVPYINISTAGLSPFQYEEFQMYTTLIETNFAS